MEDRFVNLISFDIRKILPEINENLKPEELVQDISTTQYLEKADEINQLNLGNSSDLVTDISHIIKIDDHNLKGIGLACLAGIHTFNGNYKKAIIGINQALDLTVCNDVYAYILTEYGNLLRHLVRTDEADTVFNHALHLLGNEKLKWRIITYKGYCYKYTNKTKSLNLLEDSSKYYLKNNEYSRYATIQRHLGLLHIFYSDFNRANSYLSKAKQIADHYSFQNIIYEIKNDTGWLYINEKRFDKALETFSELLTKDLIPYMESLVLQNLGFLEFERENYIEAINYHKKSLQIGLNYKMFQMLFEDYYKMGLANEKIGEYGKARKYYTNGYECLLEERKQLGIVLIAGYRGKLLDNYVRFLSEQSLASHVRWHSDTFAFSRGNTYQEILNIFQKNLLIMHRNRENKIEDLCQTLNISPRLYFVYQKRFNLSKDTIIDVTIGNQHFKNYIFSMLSLDWRAAIIQFDKDLYSFLLKKHRHNKTHIAEALSVSNLTVIKKTASLT